MISTLAFLLIGKSDGPLRASDVIEASEMRLNLIVGKKVLTGGQPGLTYSRPGYTLIWVDKPGREMKAVRIIYSKMAGWERGIADLGLNPAHAKANPLPPQNTTSPIFRNRLRINGVGNVPVSKTGKAWRVEAVEFAVVDPKLLALKNAEIKKTPFGPERTKLIRSCYMWQTEIDLDRY